MLYGTHISVLLILLSCIWSHFLLQDTPPLSVLSFQDFSWFNFLKYCFNFQMFWFFPKQLLACPPNPWQFISFSCHANSASSLQHPHTWFINLVILYWPPLAFHHAAWDDALDLFPSAGVQSQSYPIQTWDFCSELWVSCTYCPTIVIPWHRSFLFLINLITPFPI